MFFWLPDCHGIFCENYFHFISNPVSSAEKSAVVTSYKSRFLSSFEMTAMFNSWGSGVEAAVDIFPVLAYGDTCVQNIVH